ncbi:hypothetical protein AX17_005136 [Amanita inopinata Kibby_2008]|nr:hypothetical protein AX17_005136 [Amanita inopinata Kibby_2008]
MAPIGYYKAVMVPRKRLPERILHKMFVLDARAYGTANPSPHNLSMYSNATGPIAPAHHGTEFRYAPANRGATFTFLGFVHRATFMSAKSGSVELDIPTAICDEELAEPFSTAITASISCILPVVSIEDGSLNFLVLFL